jgi:hypothetical protein
VQLVASFAKTSLLGRVTPRGVQRRSYSLLIAVVRHSMIQVNVNGAERPKWTVREFAVIAGATRGADCLPTLSRRSIVSH